MAPIFAGSWILSHINNTDDTAGEGGRAGGPDANTVGFVKTDTKSEGEIWSEDIYDDGNTTIAATVNSLPPDNVSTFATFVSNGREIE